MKNKALLIATAALVLVIGAASILYSKLGEQIAPDNLAVTESSVPASEAEESSSEPDKVICRTWLFIMKMAPRCSCRSSSASPSC